MGTVAKAGHNSVPVVALDCLMIAKDCEMAQGKSCIVRNCTIEYDMNIVNCERYGECYK